MSSTASHTAHGERPERSRNAKAQARHRAKRKAYIDQLEQTVTKLQLQTGYSTEQIAGMPPPLLKIRELEQENGRLQKENDELRRLLTDTNSSSRLDPSRRTSLSTYPDLRGSERDYKRRKPHDPVYISPSETPPHGSELSSRPPPPLTIPGPQPVPHHYGGISSNSSHGAPMFNLPSQTFQMPNTPSGSSATSSPPFSASPTINASLHSSMDHRPHLSDHNSISNHYNTTTHYPPVKVEDDHYAHSSHHASVNYSYSNGHSGGSGMDWHYSSSSERAHLHR